jgi:hypothetical protein
MMTNRSFVTVLAGLGILAEQIFKDEEISHQSYTCNASS